MEYAFIPVALKNDIVGLVVHEGSKVRQNIDLGDFYDFSVWAYMEI